MLLSLMALPIEAQQLTAIVPVPTVPPGSSGTVQVTLSTPATATAPVALQFTIGSTGETGPMTATIGAAGTAAGKVLTCNSGALPSGVSMPMTCILYGADGASFSTPIGNGDVVDVTVPVLSTAKSTTEAITLSGTLGASSAGASIIITAFSSSFSVFSSCDLDHNGITDMADLALVLAQANKTATCVPSGDLNKDAACNVLDVYREVLSILPASSGVPGAGVCKVGP